MHVLSFEFGLRRSERANGNVSLQLRLDFKFSQFSHPTNGIDRGNRNFKSSQQVFFCSQLHLKPFHAVVVVAVDSHTYSHEKSWKRKDKT